MKKLLILVCAFALYQNWGKLERLVVGAPAATAARGEVVLYSTSWCGYCEATRELLTAEGIPYIDRDIEQSDEARRHHAALGGRGVPVLDAYGTILHGYNRDRILAAVK